MSQTLEELYDVDPEPLNPMEECLLAVAVVRLHLEKNVHTGPYRTVEGKIDCPVCGREDALRYRRSGYNGHVHAQCDTQDCVFFIE